MNKISENDAAMKLDEIFDPRCEGEVAHVNMFRFVDAIFEVAFGDDAISKEYSPEEVLEKLREYSDKAYSFDEEDESPAMRRGE